MSLPSMGPVHPEPFPEHASWTGAEVKEEAPDPLIGTTLQGTYAVIGILGAGGMGRVYEARHTRVATKRYAIKVLHAEFALNPELRQRFQREAEAAATIAHNGVVGTYDVGETPEGWPYMVCEYLAGVDLNAYLKERGALPPDAVAHIGRQLCSALGAAHAHGVIHRDLKPHNIFVVDRPREQLEFEGGPELPSVKVLDFGLSRFVERDNELTKTGIIIGTPGYMAPEQANGLETDLRTDVYGIGALLYASATGRAPFGEETPQLTVLAVMNGEPPRPRELVPSVPVDLEIVIQKAMARDPAERYQSAHQMGAALSQLYAPLGSLNRRAGRAGSRWLSNPRLGLCFYLALAFLLTVPSLAAASFAAFSIAGLDWSGFRPSILEWVLFFLLANLFLAAAAFGLLRFRRHTWENSSRVAELVPRLRATLIAGAAVYGFSAFVVLVTSALASLSTRFLAPSPLTSSPILYLVLPALALLGASAHFLRDSFATRKKSLARTAARVVYPLLAGALSLWLLSLPFTWHPPVVSERGTRPIEAAPQNAHTNTAKTKASLPHPIAHPHEASEPSPSPATEVSESSREPGATAESQSEPVALASKEDLAIAVHDGPEALEALHKQYPKDSKVLKALVLAHASRADTLDQSLRAIGKLLDVDPRANQDADVLFILKKALLLKGKPYAAAASAVRNKMGMEGAELLYQLMSEHPEHRARLKDLFQELRKTKRAEPSVLVAYDLRYASSCQARLPLLERAEQDGDLRSLHQLQALSTAPKRCGWGRTCYPPCKAEAERFRKSAKVIAKRLERSP